MSLLRAFQGRHSQPNEGSRKVLLAVLAFSLLATAAIQRYVVALYIIEGTSMAPTLHDGDTALVNMLAQRIGPLDRGEIVLVRDGSSGYATKRIVGLPGERLEFRDGHVYVDGQRLSENYLAKNVVTQSAHPTFDLGTREYFVLGDNRQNSFDSRSYGPVAKAAIMGSYSKSFWAYR